MDSLDMWLGVIEIVVPWSNQINWTDNSKPFHELAPRESLNLIFLIFRMIFLCLRHILFLYVVTGMLLSTDKKCQQTWRT